MLLVRLGHLVLGGDVGSYDRRGRGLRRRYMGHSVGAQRFILGFGYNKAQMSQIVVVICACNAYVIGVEGGLEGFIQGARGALDLFVDY